MAPLLAHKSPSKNELIAMPATNEQDFIAKVFAYTAEGWNGLPSNAEMPDLWAEAKRFVGGAAA